MRNVTLQDSASPRLARRVTRVSAVLVGLAAGSVAAPAFADAPSAWEPADPVNGLHALLVFVFAPLAAVAAIALLVYLPSLTGRQRAGSSLTFADEPEWFGGPRQGTEALDAAPAESNQGGASAGW